MIRFACSEDYLHVEDSRASLCMSSMQCQLNFILTNCSRLSNIMILVFKNRIYHIRIGGSFHF